MITPDNLWCLAEEYYKAGRTLFLKGKKNINYGIPCYYLYCHSIELSLKAFLLGRGINQNELKKRKYGHNLEALLNEARRRKLGREVKLDKNDLKMIKFFNVLYSNKEFEYSERWSVPQVPNASYLDMTAKKFLKGLYDYTIEKTTV